MKCEYCEEEVEKGNMDVIETVNYKFYICDDCMLEIEEMLKKFITETKDPLSTNEAPKVFIEKAGNLTKDGFKAIKDVCNDDGDIHSQIKKELHKDYAKDKLNEKESK